MHLGWRAAAHSPFSVESGPAVFGERPFGWISDEYVTRSGPVGSVSYPRGFYGELVPIAGS